MRAGVLRHYIALQHYDETRDAAGGVTKTWTTYDSVWAALRTLSGRERDIAQQERTTLTHEITIRYRDDLQPDDRIVYDSRYFDIKDVRNFDERDKMILMRCVEVLAAGPSSSPSPSASPSSSASAT